MEINVMMSFTSIDASIFDQDLVLRVKDCIVKSTPAHPKDFQ